MDTQVLKNKSLHVAAKGSQNDPNQEVVDNKLNTKAVEDTNSETVEDQPSSQVSESNVEKSPASEKRAM